MKNIDNEKSKKVYTELMLDNSLVFLYLREGEKYREVRGKITDVGDDYIKLDCFKEKRIPFDSISPNQLP